MTDWITDGQPPDIPDGETDSLCCLEPLEEGGVSVHLLVVFEDGSVTSGSVQTISAEPRLPARLDGLRPIQALTEKRVGIVGVGSGGSMAALNLAASGVGTLHLFDKDYLTTDNLFRHACGMRHVGRAKVHAVRSLIGDFDLPTSVSAYRQDVLGDATALWKAMDEVDLVLCATDNVISRRLVNYVCVRTATPLVMACTFRNAGIGEIIRVLPGESACYECTRLTLREVGALEPDAEQYEVAAGVPPMDGRPGTNRPWYRRIRGRVATWRWSRRCCRGPPS
ncbi:MAG: ThiF family adenylyltransferase [Acidobacteria bacterium]|nr:ThiF family adenylyltransferase [Acidobacteriota bacterium]